MRLGLHFSAGALRGGMSINWHSIFDNHGVKRVTLTDKDKGSYVANAEQKNALAAAGLSPSAGGGTGVTYPIEILFDPHTAMIQASYYNAVRAGSGRTPETRMGQGLTQWINVGDVIVIGNIGNRVLAAKVEAQEILTEQTARELVRKVRPEDVFRKAKTAIGKPKRKSRTVSDFIRNPYVVAAAILRANGRCEMPECRRELFNRDDGTPFLEVHHVTPLAEGGDDTLINAAALCPACHRELHYGAERKALRILLRKKIEAVTKS